MSATLKQSAPADQWLSYFPPASRPDKPVQSFPITVLFTSVSGTLSALRKAAQFAQQLSARIQILIPYVVPYPLPLEKPRVDPNFRWRHFQTVCETEPVETYLDVRLCRDAKTCIQQALLPHSLVIIGGPQSWWPLSYEKRLAKQLTGAGHHVVFTCDRRSR